MSIVHCEYDDTLWDSDVHDMCPVCENRQDAEEAYWRPLWEGERQAGLVGQRPSDPAPPADPRTPEYWGLQRRKP